MKKALVAVVAVVAAFAAGLAGVYFAMPMLAPQRVERAQAHLDSLALVDSLARAYSLGLAADTTAALPDSLAAPLTPDTLAAPPQEDTAAPDTLAARPVQAVLQDSLAHVMSLLSAVQRQNAQLLEEVAALKTHVQDGQARHADVQALSATLAKLEDKELARVVAQLDARVIEALYARASARNRTRLLQAMPPEAAAGFVRRLVQPGEDAASVVAAPDTLTTAADASETLNQ